MITFFLTKTDFFENVALLGGRVGVWLSLHFILLNSNRMLHSNDLFLMPEMRGWGNREFGVLGVWSTWSYKIYQSL